MNKGSSDIKHIGTVRLVPYTRIMPFPEISDSSYLNIDVYRIKSMIILELTDDVENEKFATINLDAETCGKLLGLCRKASRLE